MNGTSSMERLQPWQWLKPVDGLKILMNLISRLVSHLLSLDRGELIFGIKPIKAAICDMALLLFHLILWFHIWRRRLHPKLSNGILKRYPNGIPLLCYPHIQLNALLCKGIFILFGAGRLPICRSQPEQAIKYYNQVMRAQSQYRIFHYISHREIAVAYLYLWDMKSIFDLLDWIGKRCYCEWIQYTELGALLTLFFFFSGRNWFIRMEWLFVCLKFEMMMMRRIQWYRGKDETKIRRGGKIMYQV